MNIQRREMTFSKTASEIRRGIWAIEPNTALSYLPTVARILSGKSNIKLKDIQERQLESYRFVVDSNGEPVDKEEFSGQYPEDSIGVVRIIGPMIKYGDYCSWGSDELVGFARAFDEDENIIGQIWKFDTGGGSVGSVAPYHDFFKTKKKPVLSHFDMCASAGVWTASGSDFIMAENEISASFGSIGVMATLYSYKKYLADLGIKEHIIYADQSSEKNRDYEEALNGKYELMRERTLNPLAEKFQNDIKRFRSGKLNTEVEGILNGRMFFAREALAHGLIDGIGNMQDAVAQVRLLAAVRSFI